MPYNLPYFQHQLGRGSRRYTNGESAVDVSDLYPSSVANYLIDYNIASLGIATNVAIATCKDQARSGMTLDGTNHTPTNVIGTDIGGIAYASFNGSTQYLNSATNFTASQPMTYFEVAKVNDTAKAYFLMDGNNSVQARHFAFRSDSTHITVGSSPNNVAFSYDWTSNGGLWKLFEFHFNGLSSSVIVNGATIGTGNFGTGSTATNKGFTLGCRADGDPTTFGLNGSIARFVGYNQNITGSDLINLRNYFRQKYYIY